MKNILKKVSAIAMAFTLLGTGTAITKNVSPETTTPSITTPSIISIDLQQLISAKATSSKI